MKHFLALERNMLMYSTSCAVDSEMVKDLITVYLTFLIMFCCAKSETGRGRTWLKCYQFAMVLFLIF